MENLQFCIDHISMSPKGETIFDQSRVEKSVTKRSDRLSRPRQSPESASAMAFQRAQQKKQQREMDAVKIVETALRSRKGDVQAVEASINRQLQEVTQKLDEVDREDPRLNELNELKESLRAQKTALEAIPEVAVTPVQETGGAIQNVDISEKRKVVVEKPSATPGFMDRMRGGWNKFKDWFIPTPSETLTKEEKQRPTEYEKTWTPDRLAERAEDLLALNESIQEKLIERFDRVLNQLTDRRAVVLATMNRRGKKPLPDHLMSRYQTELADLQKRIQETSLDLRAARASQEYKSRQQKAA